MDIYHKLFKSNTTPTVLFEEQEGIFILKDFSRSYCNLASKGTSTIISGSTFRHTISGLSLSESCITNLEEKIFDSVQTGETQEITICGPKIGNSGNDEQTTWHIALTPFKENGHQKNSFLVMTFDVKTITNQGFHVQEEKFRSIFENSLDAILFTVPDGRILAANPEACRMFQMTERELCRVGRDGVVDMTDPRLSQALEHRESTNKVRSELTYIRKDGSKFPGEVTSSVFVNANGEERTCIILRDITSQKQYEEELNKSKENYELLFNYSPLPSWIYDNDTFKITEVNEAAIEEYGYNREEFLSLRVTDLKPIEEIPEFLALKKNVLNHSGPYRYGKVRHVRKNGDRRTKDILAHRFSKTNKTLVVSQDLTEWEKVQQDLKDKTEKLLTAQEIGRLGYWELDFETKTHYWTDEVYKIWERSKEDFGFGSQSFYETIHPDDLDALKKKQDLAFSGRQNLDYEHRIVLPDGKIKWVHEKGYVSRDASGSITGFKGSVQDITEYKTAIEKLRISEARQANLLQSQTTYLVRTDLNGNYTYSNRKFDSDFSWLFPDREVIGKCAYATFKEYHHEKVNEIFQKCIENPNKVYQVEIHKIQKDDGIKPTLWDFICLTNSNGDPMEVQGVGIDITNRVKAEQELKDSTRRYELVTKATSDAIWDWNAKTNTLIWGQGFRELFGYNTDKTKPDADSWHKFVHPEDAPRVVQHLKLVLEGTQESWDEEYRFKKADGTYAHVRDRSYINRDEKGKPLRMVGAMQDVTQQKLSLQKLVHSEARYRGLIQSQTNYLIRVDHQGNYSYCNDKFLQDFGWLYEGKGIIGENSLSSIAEYHHQKVIEIGEKCMAHPNQVFQVELDKPAKTGGMKTTLWDFILLPNADKAKVELQCVGIDITDRVEAEREIKFQARLLNTIGQSAIATDAEGKVTYWNQAAEKIYGWTHKEALGANILDITPSSQSREQAEEIMASLREGLSWSGEFPVKRKDGSEFPAFVNNSPILDEEGNLTGIIGISSDVTDRKKLEELLEKASKLSRVGSYNVDLETKEVYWSPMTKEIHGLDEDFIPNLESVIPFYPEKSLKIIRRAFNEAVTKNFEFDIETQIRTKQGKECWIRLIGQPEVKNGACVRLSGSFQDINKIKESEIEVLKTAEEKERILDSIGDAFFALDHEWVVTYWNAEAEKILQCDRKKILGKKLVDFFDIRNTPFETHYRKAAQENKTEHFEAFFEVMQSWYEVSVYPSNDGLSIFFKDVTSQKESNFKLKQLNNDLKTYTEELVTANKGLEQFSYIVSHNLRAPVANIMGLGNLLEKEEYPKEVQKDLQESLLDNVKRLDKVMYDLNHILQVKNEFSEKKERVVLQELVLSIESSLQNIIEREKVEINTDFSACAELTTLPGYIHSIFYNLIFNSIKYRRPGITPVIKIITQTKEDKVLIIFEDNGVGIDLDRRKDQIFGLYKRFHHHVEGKGMGLFMVKTQVEMLGGKISLKSTVGAGTAFTVELTESKSLKIDHHEKIHSS